MAGRRASRVRVPAGLLFYLLSVGLVSIATVGLFFGTGFLLLDQPAEQMNTEPAAQDRETEFDPERSTKPAVSTENGALSSGEAPALNPAASEAIILPPTIISPPNIGTPGESAPKSEDVSIPRPRDLGGDHLRKFSRASHSRAETKPDTARLGSGGSRSAKRADPKRDPEESAAARANQREYDQLHPTNPP